ncbi:MAG: ribosome silencing factor [Oscillospiraceae bacterium]|jgi:ribosome-associated protein|nr:ribosome silencing factor [Oscillospiraceae bacterium]
MTPKEVMELAVKSLIDKKAKDITVLRTTELTVLADYFVIASGTSLRQLRTLSDEVSKALEDANEPPLRVEGYRGGGWTLVDFGAIVLHLFTDEIRGFYDLERLWGDAPKVDVEYLITE